MQELDKLREIVFALPEVEEKASPSFSQYEMSLKQLHLVNNCTSSSYEDDDETKRLNHH